ncbi:MAG: hypothetical protein ACLQOO_10705 [Terriglobia bacterium]
MGGSEKPAGTDQVYGGTPPVAVRVWDGYGLESVPAGRGEVVVIVGG